MKNYMIAFVVLFVLLISNTPVEIQAAEFPKSHLGVLAIPIDQVPQKSMADIRGTLTDISDYIYEQSYGKIEISFELKGWFQLEGTTEEYSSNITGSINTKIASHTIELVEYELDLTLYDYIIVIHAGKSAFQIYSDFGILCFITSIPLSRIFSSVRTIVVSEWSKPTAAIQLILKDMGAPWLTWRSKGSWGISTFCVMGGGDAGLCAYTKIRLGFIEPNHIFNFENGTVQLRLTPLSSTQDGFCVVRYQVSDELYFLVEVREEIGRDAILPRHGILVTLVNETAIASKMPGIEIVFPRNCESISQSTLITGESLYSSETGFTVKVLTSSPQGASIVISDSPVQDWSIVNRLEIDNCEEVRFLQIAVLKFPNKIELIAPTISPISGKLSHFIRRDGENCENIMDVEVIKWDYTNGELLMKIEKGSHLADEPGLGLIPNWIPILGRYVLTTTSIKLQGTIDKSILNNQESIENLVGVKVNTWGYV